MTFEVSSFPLSINTNSWKDCLLWCPVVSKRLVTAGRARSFKMINLARTFVYLAMMICAALFAHATDREKYSSKYDDVDIDGILANPRLRNQYVNCIINVTPCVAGAARFLKETFGEAVLTKCSKCTGKQVIFFNKITEWFTANEPETWKRAVQIALQELQSKSG